MRICINAGHYPGKDSGAVGKTGLQEANVVKDIAKLVMSYLQKVGYDVLFVQENELYQIVDASNTYEADLFISIHCNAAENRSAKGTETFCYRFGTKGEKLARSIQNRMINILGTVDRGVKEANFAVLKNTDCPAVLVETAFISNAEDEALLGSYNGKDSFARAIALGITDYYAK